MNRLQLLLGTIGLFVGTMLYLIDRPPDKTYFVYNNNSLSLYNTIPSPFSFIGNNFPTFIHVFSFILITAGFIPCHKRGYFIVCLFWFFVNSSFELGQKFKIISLKIIPDCFTGIPFLENTENYFRLGTFDFIDLASITFGTVAAYFVLLATSKGAT